MKVRSYVDLTPEDKKMLAAHFEVLDSAIGAEIVIVSFPINFDMYLDEKSYPDLKIIASQGPGEPFMRGRANGRSIQIIISEDNIIRDLVILKLGARYFKG